MSITFYTSRICPYAHRAHIALAELGLEYKEVPIDQAKPREPWSWKSNPFRGLVPALEYNHEIIVESSIISTFLTDLKDNHLVPLPGTPDAAQKRAKINFFVDTFFSKAQPLVQSAILAPDAATKPSTQTIFSRITLAEVLTASFVIRLYSYSKPGADLISAEAMERVKKISNWKKWADALHSHESMGYIRRMM
ncbi:hypothetical protein L873DRAFT_1827051 [Choiromyces venosus 120613-1]|uniref:GST N-terminal domain-containing protein n=1 Tax=Choiromyces venosus 120613-1 TaxID=1336337 RepID=A0A3N4JY40_9PEZI|nr:hypothetical protein L873DRAFT_1827051 [Choiromyces venosus 120613-1]